METAKISLQVAEKERKTTEGELVEVEEEELMIKKKKERLQSILQEKEDTEVLLKIDVRQQEEKLAEQEEEVKNAKKEVDVLQHQIKALPEASGSALRISFDDISLCNYRTIFKILLKYRYRIFFENITRY